MQRDRNNYGIFFRLQYMSRNLQGRSMRQCALRGNSTPMSAEQIQIANPPALGLEGYRAQQVARSASRNGSRGGGQGQGGSGGGYRGSSGGGMGGNGGQGGFGGGGIF